LTEGIACPDETEVLRVRKIPLIDAIQMVERSEITDAMSVAGLLKAAILFKSPRKSSSDRDWRLSRNSDYDPNHLHDANGEDYRCEQTSNSVCLLD